MERRRGPPGQPDWAATDRVVAAARAHGLRVLANISYAPAWARGRFSRASAPPRSLPAWSAFVAAATTRYRGQVAAYEIWNEPNLAKFYGGRVDPASYAGLLVAAADAVRRSDPDAQVLLGGLTLGGSDPVAFLEAVYRDGGGDSFDALSIHPYFTYRAQVQGRAMTLTDLEDLHRVLADHGDGHRLIWATELGVPTVAGGPNADQQADYVLALLGVLADVPYSGPAMIYAIRDTGRNRWIHAQNYGSLAYQDWRPKPLAALLARTHAGGRR